jgi:hypothetical protein
MTLPARERAFFDEEDVDRAAPTDEEPKFVELPSHNSS